MKEEKEGREGGKEVRRLPDMLAFDPVDEVKAAQDSGEDCFSIFIFTFYIKNSISFNIKSTAFQHCFKCLDSIFRPLGCFLKCGGTEPFIGPAGDLSTSRPCVIVLYIGLYS